MGKMSKAEVVSVLAPLNPRAGEAKLNIYAAAFVEFHVAQLNLDAHGSIVFHPRTGAPMENPYSAVRDRCARVLLGLDLKVGSLWTRVSSDVG